MRCPRCLNERADLLSHAADLERHSDFFLPLPLLQRLQHHWRLRFTLDLFATRRSARLPRYVTRFYDPLAVFHDAFPRSFVGYTPHTALSPLSSILPLLHAYAGSSSCHSGPVNCGILASSAQRDRVLLRPHASAAHASSWSKAAHASSAPIGHAQDPLRFPPDTSPSLALPQGTLWTLLVDFRPT